MHWMGLPLFLYANDEVYWTIFTKPYYLVYDIYPDQFRLWKYMRFENSPIFRPEIGYWKRTEIGMLKFKLAAHGWYSSAVHWLVTGTQYKRKTKLGTPPLTAYSQWNLDCNMSFPRFSGSGNPNLPKSVTSENTIWLLWILTQLTGLE